MKKLGNLLHAHDNLVDHVTRPESHFPEKIAMDNVLPGAIQQALTGGSIKSYRQLSQLADFNGSRNENAIGVWAFRLKEKLLEEMSLQDYSGTMRTEYNRSRYEVQRSLMLAHVLKVKGLGSAAMQLWERTLLKARRYSLTAEALVCAQHLCYEYAFRKKPAKHYTMLRNAQKLMNSLQAEFEASRHYQRLIFLMKGKWHMSPAWLPVARQSAFIIRNLAAKHRTHELYSMQYRSAIYHHYASHDSKGLLKTCRQYRNYLLNHKRLQQDSRWAEIAMHQVNASIALGNYKTGIRLAEQNKKFMRPENPNWFTYQANYFQLLMNAGEYMKAKRLYGEVMYSQYRKHIRREQEDVWKVFLAYLQLALHSHGMIGLFKPRYHFSRLTSCKSDKAGLNFLIEAGLLMYLFIQEDRSDLDIQAERFRKYVKRYIDKKELPRHYLFSKMLLQIVRHRHRSADYVRRMGQKYLDRLKASDNLHHGDFEANELIRFEKLWKILLEQL